MLHRKDLKFVAADKITNEDKFKSLGQSARSQQWFDFDFYWIKVNFSTREPDFYKRLFQCHANTQDKNTYKRFQVTRGNKRSVEIFKFHNDTPILNYCHKSLKSCCFSSLASSFASIKQNKAAYDIS